MEYFYLFLLALGCEILGTLSGFGSSVIFVPLASYLLPRNAVLAVTSLMHVFSNVVKVWMFRKTIDWKLALLFGIPSLLLTIVGAFLVSYIDSTTADVILSFFLIAFSLLFLLLPKLKMKETAAQAITTGSVAGFAAGLLGTGGAIRAIGLIAFSLEKNLFVGTSAAIDFGVDFSRMFIYAGQGFFQSLNIWIYPPLLFVASWLGTFIGKKLLDKINPKHFRMGVLLLILAVGISMIVKHYW